MSRSPDHVRHTAMSTGYRRYKMKNRPHDVFLYNRKGGGGVGPLHNKGSNAEIIQYRDLNQWTLSNDNPRHVNYVSLSDQAPPSSLRSQFLKATDKREPFHPVEYNRLGIIFEDIMSFPGSRDAPCRETNPRYFEFKRLWLCERIEFFRGLVSIMLCAQSWRLRFHVKTQRKFWEA